MTDWDTSFEANPANTENISQGAERIRIFKEVARETIAIDHYLVPAGTMADNGKHNKATLIKQDPAPSSAADQGVLFSAAGAGTSSDTTELFYIDSAGRSRQLTWEGSAPFPVDTKMYFYQNAAPAGWEFESTSGDRALIGAATVGAGGSTYNDTANDSKNYTWNIVGADAWKLVTTHTLTTAEIPAHKHEIFVEHKSVVHDDHGTRGKSDVQPAEGDPVWETEVDGGDGGGHTHNGWGDGTWRPSASIVILCKKLF